MSQEKAQLIAPIGITTFTGLTATGVITASSFAGSIVGSAKSLVTGTNVTAGVMTATSFVGNLTGNIQRLVDGTPNINVGVTTATSFVGNLTGSVTDLTSAPNITVGVVTATRFQGPVTGDVTGNVTGNVTGVATGTQSGGNIVGNVIGNVTGDVQGDVTGNVTGNIQGDVTGDITGNVTGNIQGDVTGDITGNIQGAVTGDITGNIQGAVTGNITGDIQGDVTGDVTGNLQGAVTGNVTGDVQGDVTGDVTGNLQGNVTGNVTGDAVGDVTGNITGNVQGNVTGNVTGNATGIAAGGLGINYNGGWTGAGTSQVRVGVVTATTLYGDGSNLDGISSGPVSQQSVTANSATTAIDLSSGNVIYMTQSANTTISFSNPENGNVYLIRTKDDNTTARTITWPDSIKWDGGSAPTLIQDNPRTSDAQVFLFVTRNMGVTWYGKEVVRFDPQTFALWGAGRNLYGTLGNNAAGPGGARSSPTQIGAVWKNVADAASAAYSRIAVRADGTLWAWGNNPAGQLGLNQQGNPANRSSPTQVGTDTDWSQARAISNHAVASKTDGSVWMWGQNEFGQLGTNDKTWRSSPTQLAGTWSWATGGAQNSIGTKSDGTLWCWGRADRGAVGNNNTTHRSSPVSLGSGWDYGEAKSKNFNDISVAFKSNGELWAWGKNQSRGLLGISDTSTNYFSSPKQVPGTTWSEIGNGGSGFNGYCASRTNGTIRISGTNSEGQYGNNSSNSGSPGGMVEVCGGKTFDPKVTDGQPNFACGGGYRMIAADSNGQIWVWGANNYGGAGQNDNNDGYSSPVQIPGKTGFDQFSYSNDGTWLGRVMQ